MTTRCRRSDSWRNSGPFDADAKPITPYFILLFHITLSPSIANDDIVGLGWDGVGSSVCGKTNIISASLLTLETIGAPSPANWFAAIIAKLV